MVDIESLQISEALPFEISTTIDECEVSFSLDIYVNNKVDARFIRQRNRWRVSGGCYCKQSIVAMHLFGMEGDVRRWLDLPDIARSFMLKHVACLTQILDEIISSYERGWIEQRIQAERKFRERFTCGPKGVYDNRSRIVTIETDSHLYLMRHSNGLTKIGKSINPQSRERTLQAEDPRLSIVFVASNKGCYEKALHCIFADLRKRGEWFDLDEHHVEWIRFFFEGFPDLAIFPKCEKVL